MATKLLAIGSIILGFLIVAKFPSHKEYQPEKLSYAGVLVGLILMILGIYFLLT
jgi:hypothetical protein